MWWIELWRVEIIIVKRILHATCLININDGNSAMPGWWEAERRRVRNECFCCAWLILDSPYHVATVVCLVFSLIVTKNEDSSRVQWRVTTQGDDVTRDKNKNSSSCQNQSFSQNGNGVTAVSISAFEHFSRNCFDGWMMDNVAGSVYLLYLFNSLL